VPQLNVFAVGFPAKVVVVLLLVGATMPFVGGWISAELQRDVGSALDTLKVA
jgi:flagellar biosynthesis protein FliR